MKFTIEQKQLYILTNKSFTATTNENLHSSYCKKSSKNIKPIIHPEYILQLLLFHYQNIKSALRAVHTITQRSTRNIWYSFSTIHPPLSSKITFNNVMAIKTVCPAVGRSDRHASVGLAVWRNKDIRGWGGRCLGSHRPPRGQGGTHFRSSR